MRSLFLLIPFLLVPGPAAAQLIVRDGKPTTEQTESAILPARAETATKETVVQGTDYPVSAITAIDSHGRVSDGSALAPDPVPTRVTPEDSALWPKDTVIIFLSSCAGANRALDASCGCIIRDLMKEMPQNEFLRLSKNRDIDGDARYQRIRRMCLSAAADQRQTEQQQQLPSR